MIFINVIDGAAVGTKKATAIQNTQQAIFMIGAPVRRKRDGRRHEAEAEKLEVEFAEKPSPSKN